MRAHHILPLEAGKKLKLLFKEYTAFQQSLNDIYLLKPWVLISTTEIAKCADNQLSVVESDAYSLIITNVGPMVDVFFTVLTASFSR